MNDLTNRLTALLHWPEIVVVCIALLLSSVFARFLRTPVTEPRRKARGLLPPLVALALLTLARFTAHRLHWPGELLGLAMVLIAALIAVRIIGFALAHTLGDSQSARYLEKSLALCVWLGVALDSLGLLSEFTNWLDSFSLHIGKNHVTVWQIAQGVFTIAISLILALWLGALAENRLAHASGLDSSLRVVFSRLIKAILVLIAVLTGVALAGLDITTLSVFSGALGVGLGFGLQKIASNYVSGFIILLDRSIRIGNLIQITPEQRGEVLQINTRYTVLRGRSGVHFIVPNESLVTSLVQDDTFDQGHQCINISLQVRHDTSLDQALRCLEASAKGAPRLLSEPQPRSFLAEVSDIGLRLELAVWVKEPLKGSLEVRSYILRQALNNFAEAGIQLAVRPS